MLFFVIDVMGSSEAFSVESARIASCWPRANNLAVPAHVPKGRGRYVDDVLLFSNVYCHSCLSLVMSEVCAGIVKFNIEPETKALVCGTLVVPYLEVDLHISYMGVRVLMIHKNEAFALTGDQKYYKKRSLPLTMALFVGRCRIQALYVRCERFLFLIGESFV